jgi:hypothetical protein
MKKYPKMWATFEISNKMPKGETWINLVTLVDTFIVNIGRGSANA